MGRLFTQQEAEKIFLENGYKLLEEYKRADIPLRCEKDGYWYMSSLHNVQGDKSLTLWGFTNINNVEHNVKEYIKKKHGTIKYLGYEVVQKNHQKRILVKLLCGCGKEFNRNISELVYRDTLYCPECSKKKMGHKRRQSKRVMEYIESRGYKILDRTQSYRTSDLVEVEDSDGYRGYVMYNRLRDGKGMSKFDVRINKENYIYNVNVFAESNGIESKCVGFSDKSYARQGLHFICSCGEEFDTSISAFQSGRARCSHCSKSESKYEYIFKKYLDSLNIKYIQQYSLNQCRDILPLPFDFYVDYKFFVEIDGQGHFHPCNFNHTSDEKAIKSFESTQKHDKIKDDFCKNNNIPLLRISYSQIEDESYKEIFQNFIGGLANSG